MSELILYCEESNDNLKTREDAERAGFAVFNRGPHICVDVPEGHCTLSVRLPSGEKMTLAFVPSHSVPSKHQCVDVQQHGTPTTDNGVPIQRVACLGQGPTRYVSNDQEPTTLVVFKLG